MDPVFVKGVIATVFSLIVFVGTIWLVMSLVLGARMAYLVIGSVFFGIMVILSGMWFMNALGPKGAETTWHAIAVGDDLTEVKGFGATYDVSDYPQGTWQRPKHNLRFADQHPQIHPCLSLITPCPNQDTRKESKNVQPVMTTLVSQAISPIPGKRAEVKGAVQGTLSLKSGTKFTVTDMRMREAIVDGKPSIVSMGRAVPSAQLVTESLEGLDEGKVSRYLVKIGSRVTKGAPILEASNEGKNAIVRASAEGRVIDLGLRVGDKVKAGVPVATIDLSGQTGQPSPAEVVAVRVRGAVRTPAMFYLIASLLLFAVHMGALSRAERKQRPATAAA